MHWVIPPQWENLTYNIKKRKKERKLKYNKNHKTAPNWQTKPHKIHFSTGQSGRHRWCSWHLQRSPLPLGNGGSFCGPWFYCRFPPESRHRTGCHLRVGWGTEINDMQLHHKAISLWWKKSTNQQASRKWRLPQTTSHTPFRNNRLLPEISAPLGRCSQEFPQLCHSAPCQSETQEAPFNLWR